MLLKKSFEVFVETDLQQGLFEEGPLDCLVELVVKIFPNDVGQVVRFVGVEVFLLFDHEIQTKFS